MLEAASIWNLLAKLCAAVMFSRPPFQCHVDLSHARCLSGEEKVHKYPSSSHYTRNWDKLVAEVKREEKEEKPEGDAALNKLFQQIYHDGSDEVRKAMNKSFVSKPMHVSMVLN